MYVSSNVWERDAERGSKMKRELHHTSTSRQLKYSSNCDIFSGSACRRFPSWPGDRVEEVEKLFRGDM